MPDIPNWAWHEYGNRVGFWRMLEVFDDLRVPAVLAINGSAIARYAAIAEAARELYERGTKFGGDLVKLGQSLQKAVSAYNAAVGSFDSRFVPMARRLEELHVNDTSKPTLDAPTPIDEVPRALRNPGSDAAAA